MKTKTINLYQFEEAPEELKSKILENYSDINCDYGWWNDDCYYDFKKCYNIKLEEFDINNRTIKIKLPRDIDALFTENRSDNDKLSWLEDIIDANRKEFNRIQKESNEDYKEDCYDKLYDTMTEEIGEEILKMLREDYEYRTSEEAISDTLIANEYYFNSDGKIDD